VYAARVRIAWLVVLLASVPVVAHAQETGGSIESSGWDEPSSGGSSSWGSSSSSGSDWGSSGSSYPSTSYDTSSYSGSQPPRGSGDLDGPSLLVLLGAIAFVCFIVFVQYQVAQGSRPSPTYDDDAIRVVGPHAVAGRIDLSTLQLAIDWRARRFVQDALRRLAGTEVASKEGRLALLRATTSALDSVRLAWIYAGARNYAPMDKALAQFEFQRTVNDLRASFRQELVRATAGRVVTVEAMGVRAREHEGAGVVLVSLVVASRKEIFDVDARNAHSIDRLLGALAALTADDLVAVSVVWTPAAEEDRMSTDELESRNRHLVKIGGVGGRVFCSYCHGPHTAELTHCPHCGAPSAQPAA
jgi:uncharacterized membrane protein